MKTQTEQTNEYGFKILYKREQEQENELNDILNELDIDILE